MKILGQILVIFMICLVSEGISAFLPFPFPGSLIGMLLIFGLLVGKVLKEEYIKETADFLIRFMAFMFVPIGVEVVRELAVFQGKLAAVVLTIILVSVITFLTAYLSTLFVIKLQNKLRKDGKNGSHLG